MNIRMVSAVLVGLLFSVSAWGITYNGFADTSSLTLNGSTAVVSTSDGSVLRLTPASGGQSGSAFSSVTVNAARFSTFFKFRITEPGGQVFDCNTEPGADGLVFVVQAVSSDIGGAGQGIGYAGIDTSVGVEFDTWCNAGNNDPNSNHLGIDVNGSVDHASGEDSDTITISPNFDDGKIWYAWVDYDGAVLEVRVNQSGLRPNLPSLSKSMDIPAILGNVDDAFVGFTSGTGADWGNHDVLFWEYREDFDPVSGVSPCCAEYDPATGTAVIPCLKVKGDLESTLSVTLQQQGSVLVIAAIGEGVSDCCPSSGGGGDACDDCSCADYAAAHPEQCGRTGSLNFRVTWNDKNDVDLHVAYSGEGGSEEIYYGNSTGSLTGGELDVDSNAGCSSNVTENPVENIVFDTPPSGAYEFKVCGYSNCIGGAASTAKVQALSNGTVFWESDITVSQWSNHCETVYTYNR